MIKKLGETDLTCISFNYEMSKTRSLMTMTKYWVSNVRTNLHSICGYMDDEVISQSHLDHAFRLSSNKCKYDLECTYNAMMKLNKGDHPFFKKGELAGVILDATATVAIPNYTGPNQHVAQSVSDYGTVITAFCQKIA